VKGVNNPIESSGGADPEARDDARRNIPVSLQAMGRIVSVRDYADFARTFAGITKASAAALSDGRKRVVHVTIGGSGDIDIDVTSDLYRNVVDALHKFGDPYQPLVVVPRDKIVVAGAARVRVDPDYLWALVAPKVRAALLDVFSYDRRDFGQAVYPAEVVAAIQGVLGVVNVDLDALGGIEAAGLAQGVRIDDVATIVPRLARPGPEGGLLAAQIAYLPPELADLFILTEITHD
jgi:predicted phage baseplate assembly protein